MIGGFPVADGTREAIGSVEREEEQRGVAVVGEDVDNGVKLGADGQPKELSAPFSIFALVGTDADIAERD